MTAETDGEYCTKEKLVKKTQLQPAPEAMHVSPGSLHSWRRAPPLASAFAPTVQSEKPAAAATFPGLLAGLSGIVACSEQQDDTVIPTHSPSR